MPHVTAKIANQRFGMLVALAYAGKGKWLCRCDCGKVTEIITANLTRGNSKSCGCKLHPKKHGLARHPLNGLWRSMRARCNNSSDAAYANYGGRGIKVCARWDDFTLFLADMGPRPKGYQLDRRDNERGYEPDNCHWVRQRDNLNNKRTSRKLTWRGETLTVAQWADRTHIHQRTIHNRVFRSGWDVERALSTPSQKGAVN